MERARDLTAKLEKYVQEENVHFFEVRENLKMLKTTLLKPMESFEILVKEMSEINLAYASHPISTGRVESQKQKMESTYVSFNE
jgi:hypothetical protein